jgi:hypothetical protein
MVHGSTIIEFHAMRYCPTADELGLGSPERGISWLIRMGSNFVFIDDDDDPSPFLIRPMNPHISP